MESSVFWSGEGCTLFTHSREAPSRVARVRYTDLASGLLLVQMKLWDMFYNFVSGYGGRGAYTIILHTL